MKCRQGKTGSVSRSITMSGVCGRRRAALTKRDAAANPILPRTRGEAREYLQKHLPGILNGG